MQPLQKNFWQEDESTRQVRWYVATAKRPWLFGAGALLLVYVVSVISFLDWSSVLLARIGWGILAVAMLWSVILIARTKRQEYTHAVTTGVIGGALLGLFHAVVQLVWFRSGWLLFNVLAEPLFAALAGALAGLVVVVIWQRLDRWKFHRAANTVVVPSVSVESPSEITEEEIVVSTPVEEPPAETTPAIETASLIEIETVVVEPVAPAITPDVADESVEQSPVPVVVAHSKTPARKKNTKSLARPRYARNSSKQKPPLDQPSSETNAVSTATPAKRRRRSVS